MALPIRCPVCGRESAALSERSGLPARALSSLLYHTRVCYSCGIRFRVDKIERLLGLCFPARPIQHRRLELSEEAPVAEYDNLSPYTPALHGQSHEYLTRIEPLPQQDQESPLLLRINCRSLGLHFEFAFRGIPRHSALMRGAQAVGELLLQLAYGIVTAISYRKPAIPSVRRTPPPVRQAGRISRCDEKPGKTDRPRWG